MSRSWATWIAAALAVLLPSLAAADEVLLSNGDRISGVTERIGDEKLKITSDLAGEIIVDLKHVHSVTTIQPATAPTTIVSTAPTTSATTQAIAGAPAKPKNDAAAALADLWVGTVKFSANVARGNSHAEAIGIAIDAATKREPGSKDDRLTFAAAYNLGRTRDDDGVYTTSADNHFAQAKYDHFFTPRWYGYGMLRYDHDRLANLRYRLSPGVGSGYLWSETPDFKFLTEAGFNYVVEEYRNNGIEERVAVRFAYKLEKKLNENVSLFHNLEWLPSVEDISDYNLNTDAGVRAKLTKAWFAELKLQWQRDSSPAPGAEEDDFRFLLGVGFTF